MPNARSATISSVHSATGPQLIEPSIERVLVTGASGFIAQAVVDRLQREDREAITLDRSVPADSGRHAVDHVADLVDLDLDPIVGSVDAVIHLAGTPGVQSSWADGFDLHVRNNLVATQRLCESALRTECQRIVIASSSSVYGSVARGLVDEDRAPTPLSPYGASKAATEHLVGAYAARGLSVIPLRYFTVYGPWQRPDMAIHRMFRAALGGPAFPLRGDGLQARSFTAVDDVAAATVTATRRNLPTGLPINIGGSDVTSLNELLQRIEVLTGRPVPIEQLPAAPGDPARTAANLSRAASLLGWSPSITIDDGLAGQWEWHRAMLRRQADTAQVAASDSADVVKSGAASSVA